ncbi:MAG: alpha/beta hydrolase [Nostocoides sp.]
MAPVLTLPGGRMMAYAAYGAPEGRPVLYFHGTPGTEGTGAIAEEAALAHHLRLIALTRPGYGETTLTPPGLASVARDALVLADTLGLETFLTHGVSGGGPYAVAVAAVAPDRVDGVLASAGTGRHLEIKPEAFSQTDREQIARATAGDLEGATAAMTAQTITDMGPLLELDADAFAVAFRALLPPGERSMDDHPEIRRILMADVHQALRTVAGYVRDHLSWGMPWDIDLGAITSPTLLVHGDRDAMVPADHGQWLAERIPGAERIVLADADHGVVTMLRLDEQYARLVAIAR